MQYRIVGDSLPVVLIELSAGEEVLSENGGRTWQKGDIELQTTSEGGFGKMFKRSLSGESVFMSRYHANGPAEIGFASSFPGSIIAKELGAGEAIICQKKAFLCGTGGVSLDAYVNKKLGAGLIGGEGFIMQKVSGPGVAFLEVDGFCQEYVLGPGESVVCDTGVLAAMDESCTMSVQQVKGLKNKLLGGEGIFDTVITGPGHVYLQSMTMANIAGLLAPFIVPKK